MGWWNRRGRRQGATGDLPPPEDGGVSSTPARTRMNAMSAAIIGTSIATLIIYGFECWIDGHWTKNMLAAGAFTAFCREIAAYLLAGEAAPPMPDTVPVANVTLGMAASIVRNNPDRSPHEVADAIESLRQRPGR